MMSRSIPLCAALALLVMPAGASSAAAEPGAVIVSNGTTVPQIMRPGPLQLDNAQREQVRKAVLTEHTEVEFKLPETKPAKDFTPAVGAKLPSSLTPVGLPQPLLTQLPQLRNYDYLKVKDQVLIVNAMTHTIVDMFSETQSGERRGAHRLRIIRAGRLQVAWTTTIDRSHASSAARGVR